MRLFLEIKPLCERHLTGIGETCLRLAQCALHDDVDDIRFIIGGSQVQRDIVGDVVESENGSLLAAFVAGGFADQLQIDPHGWNTAIYTHHCILPKQFDAQAIVTYDLTPLLFAQYHTEETVRDFRRSVVREFASVDAIAAISTAVAEDIKRYFPEFAAKVKVAKLGTVMPSPNDLQIAQLGSSGKKPYLLALATLEPRKNSKAILHMVAAWPALLDEFILIFVGNSGWGQEMPSLICGLGLQSAFDRGDILLTGFVDKEEKQRLLAGCSAMLYPSHYEGFGLPVLEALALGKPVVCQRSSSLPEVAGELAFYMDGPEPADLADALRRLIATLPISPDRQRAFTRHAEGFSWDRTWSTLKKMVVKPLADLG